MRLTAGIALAALCVPGMAVAAEPHITFTATVVAIADGDTLTVRDEDNREFKILLAGIDAPEIDQQCGSQARDHLAGKVPNRTVDIEVVEIDQYYRHVAGRMSLGKRSINREMVVDGFAWRDVRHDKSGEFTAAEANARKHRCGLWANQNPVPPWEWRRMKWWHARR